MAINNVVINCDLCLFQLFRYLMTLLITLTSTLLVHTYSVRSYLVHPAVLANDAEEALLPAHFRRSRLVTPQASVLLAKSSWFGDGEKEVYI